MKPLNLDNPVHRPTYARPRAADDVRLLHLSDGLHLANLSGRHIPQLVYSTWTYVPNLHRRGAVTVTERPFVRVRHVPPRSHLFLDVFDPYDGGTTFYRVEHLTWDDGLQEGPVLLHEESGHGWAPREGGAFPDPATLRLEWIERAQCEVHREPGGLLPVSALLQPGVHHELRQVGWA